MRNGLAITRSLELPTAHIPHICAFAPARLAPRERMRAPAACHVRRTLRCVADDL